jgi:hypothetical protein
MGLSLRSLKRIQIHTLTFALTCAAVGASFERAHASEPLFERFCDALLEIAVQNPETAKEFRTGLLREHLNKDFRSQVHDLSRGNLRYLGFSLAQEPNQAWANRIPHRTSSAQKGFFKYVHELLTEGIKPPVLVFVASKVPLRSSAWSQVQAQVQAQV